MKWLIVLNNILPFKFQDERKLFWRQVIACLDSRKADAEDKQLEGTKNYVVPSL